MKNRSLFYLYYSIIFFITILSLLLCSYNFFLSVTSLKLDYINIITIMIYSAFSSYYLTNYIIIIKHKGKLLYFISIVFIFLYTNGIHNNFIASYLVNYNFLFNQATLFVIKIFIYFFSIFFLLLALYKQNKPVSKTSNGNEDIFI